MAYFSKFPLTRYPFLENSEVKHKVAVNILKRVGVAPELKDATEAFTEYEVQDGETPELIADKLYGSPELHWLVLIFNDIIHPYYDWPKSNLSNENWIEKTYPGISLFLSGGGSGGTGCDGDGVDVKNMFTGKFIKNETIYHTDGETNLEGAYFSLDGEALVHSWDPDLSKLTLKYYTRTFEEGDRIATGATAGSRKIATVQRVTTTPSAVHHFDGRGGITGDFEYLNPLAEVNNETAVLGSTGGVVESTVKFYATNLGAYMGVCGDNSNNNVITIQDYEDEINNDKRTIKLLHPKYLQLIDTSLDDLLNA